MDRFLVIPGENRVAIDLLGHSLDLGLAQQVVRCTQILNEASLREILSKDDLDDDTHVEIHLAIDLDNSYVDFENWPRQ